MAITADMTDEILGRYGSDAVFYTDTETYDPETGETTRSDEETYTITVVEENRKSKIPGDADAVLYASPANMEFTPTTQMKVVYASRTWTVVEVSPVVYQGTTVLYAISVKGVAV